MTNAEKYAQRIQKRYNIRDYKTLKLADNLPDEIYDTIEKVAKKVLPLEVYNQWKQDIAKEVNGLRDKLGLTAKLGHIE